MCGFNREQEEERRRKLFLMLAVGAASAVGAMASASASNAVSHAISGLIFGCKSIIFLLFICLLAFNPNYNKEDRKRMRYIQNKYAQAYSDSNEDANVVIASVGSSFLFLLSELSQITKVA